MVTACETMSPEKGLNAEQRAAKKFSKGFSEIVQGQCIRLCQALKANKGNLDPVERFMRSCGLIDATGIGITRTGNALNLTAKSEEEATVQAVASSPSGASGSGGVIKEEQPEEDLADHFEASTNSPCLRIVPVKSVSTWDKNWTHCGRLGPVFLELNLTFVVPQIFTAANIRALKRPGQRALCLNRGLQYLEFISNKDGNAFIGVDLRTQDGWIAHLRDAHQHYGNRGLSLCFEKAEEDQWGAR